jgi:hypothetical protein
MALTPGSIARADSCGSRPALVRGDDNPGVQRGGILDLRRHVEHGVAPSLLRDLDDHPPGAHDLARLGTNGRHDSVRTGHQPRVAEPVLRLRQLRLGGFNPGLGAAECGLRLLEDGLGGGALGHQPLLPVVVAAGFVQARAGRVQLCLRRLHGTLLVFGIEAGEQLPGPDGVAHADGALDQPAVDAEGLVDLGLRLHRAGQRDHAGIVAGLDRDGSHGADLDGWYFCCPLAGRKQSRASQGDGEGRESRTA